MIYLHPSRHIVPPSAGSFLPLEEDYLDKLSKLEGREGRFRLVIEASNGTALQGGIKETLLSARLYAQDGRDLSDALKGLNPYWEVREGETWHEVGRGWTYLVKDSKSLRTLYQVRVSQLDILTALGVTLPNSMQRVLEEIIIAQQITITGWLSMLAQLPSEQLICDRLISSQSFLARVKGEKGDPGKSVTAQEVVQQLNTSTFRDAIRDSLKADAQFVSTTKGLKGDPADPVRPNLLRGFLGTERRTTSAQGSANVHARLGIKPFLEVGKKYVLSADFELLEGSANAVSLGLVTTAGGFIRETKTALNGTKTRASLYINIDDTINLDSIVDVVGYAGEHGKSRGNLARYYNIKLEEVISDSDKASAYLPHPDDLKGADGKSVTLADLNIQWQGDRLSVAGKTSGSLKGDSPTAASVASAINTTEWQAKLADQTASKITNSSVHLAKIRQGMATKQDMASLDAMIGERVAQLQLTLVDQDAQIKGFAEESTYRQHKLTEEVAVQKESIRAINNQIETQVLDPIRDIRSELLQQESKAQQLIQRFATRHVASLITTREGANYVVKVQDFYEFDPIIEDGATVSLHVDIKHPNNHCVVALNHDAIGYFFYVRANRDIFSTDAEPLGKNVKVYYNSELCAEQSLTVRLERSGDHWIFLNYRDFAAGIQSESTQIRTQSHYSKSASDQALSYAPLQYISGMPRDAILPPARQGIVIKIWANNWVGDIRVRPSKGDSLYNTANHTAGDISSEGALIPRGHLSEFICINDANLWIFTDLSR